MRLEARSTVASRRFERTVNDCVEQQKRQRRRDEVFRLDEAAVNLSAV